MGACSSRHFRIRLDFTFSQGKSGLQLTFASSHLQQHHHPPHRDPAYHNIMSQAHGTSSLAFRLKSGTSPLDEEMEDAPAAGAGIAQQPSSATVASAQAPGAPVVAVWGGMVGKKRLELEDELGDLEVSFSKTRRLPAGSQMSREARSQAHGIPQELASASRVQRCRKIFLCRISLSLSRMKNPRRQISPKTP